VGISFDGGQTWQDQPLPGVGQCAGGTTARASDPWLAFAPNGDLYAVSLAVTAQGTVPAILVSKSTDGGLTWQNPVSIPGTSGADKESVTTDPFNSNLVYVVWTGGFSRSTDGGQTFSSARRLGIGSGAQIVALADDTLVASDGGEVFRSTNQGQTWSNAILLPRTNPQQVTDPNNHQTLRAGLGLGDIAVDPNSGTLYVVTEDANITGGGYDGISLMQSFDEGLTWTRPMQVNQTPTSVPTLDRQAFIPTVQVDADGTVGVAYYDFRNNQGGSYLGTDCWFATGTPDGSGGISWGYEQSLTDWSFDFEQAPVAAYGKFVGDYQGRAPDGNDMVTSFSFPAGNSGDALFFRRAINLGNSPGGGNLPGGGRLGSPSPELALLLRVDPAGVPFLAAPTPEQPTPQPRPVDVAAGADLWLGGAEPFTARFIHDSHGQQNAASAQFWDVIHSGSLFSQEIEVSGTSGTAASSSSL
jgi:hypothetical protein